MQYVLDKSWENVEKVVVYGFGKTSRGNIDSFIDEFSCRLIIDNNPVFKGKYYRNIPIIDFATYISQRKLEDKIILLAAGKARASIKKELNLNGLVENKDYTDFDIFSAEWFLRFRGEIRMAKLGVSITNRCTFKCKGCNMLMPYYKNPKDYKLEMLTNSLDCIFFNNIVKRVNCFTIIGGEPLLHSRLEEYLEYLGNHYRDRISNIQLITNGSILPSDSLIKVIKKYDIQVRISDYTATIDYKKRLNQVKEKLENSNIEYIDFKQIEWIDFGFPEKDVCMGNTSNEIREHMLRCHGMCWWLHGDKMYYCSNAWSGEETGMITLKPDQDYIDLKQIKKEGEIGKEKLYAFYIGNMKEGYMTHCKRCRGFECDMTIPAGEQMII